MSVTDGETHHVVVEIEPPADVVARARQRAGEDEIEAHLLDQVLFEFDWVGVQTNE